MNASDNLRPNVEPTSRNYLAICQRQALQNLKAFQSILSPTTSIMLVMKANAYGHGDYELSRIFEHHTGINQFAVGTPDEAVRLRLRGVRKPIVVLTGFLPGEFDAIRDYDLIPVVHDLSTLKHLAEFARRVNRSIPIHLKLDSGMNRLGIVDSLRIARLVHKTHLVIQGAMTHLAAGDHPRSHQTKHQLRLFSDVLDRLFRSGIKPLYAHAASTAAVLSGCATPRCNMVRIGRGILGLVRPSELSRSSIKALVAPVLEWSTTVLSVKNIRRGAQIGYGPRDANTSATRIAVVGVGYADGLSRFRNSPVYFRVGRELCPVIGEVSMGLTTIDVSSVESIAPGDEVSIVSGHVDNGLNDLADATSVIPAELTCRLPCTTRRVVCCGAERET